MTDREKLIEILENAGKMRQYPGSLASILIENGVTFATENNVGSKWISVTERLPQPGDVVLVFDIYRCYYMGTYLYNTSFRAVGCPFITTAVAWMPLPEPPKEET